MSKDGVITVVDDVTLCESFCGYGLYIIAYSYTIEHHNGYYTHKFFIKHDEYDDELYDRVDTIRADHLTSYDVVRLILNSKIPRREEIRIKGL